MRSLPYRGQVLYETCKVNDGSGSMRAAATYRLVNHFKPLRSIASHSGAAHEVAVVVVGVLARLCKSLHISGRNGRFVPVALKAEGTVRIGVVFPFFEIERRVRHDHVSESVASLLPRCI